MVLGADHICCSFLFFSLLHHQLDGHECEQALRVGDGQESLACCSSCGCKESDTTDWLNWLILFSVAAAAKSCQSCPTVCDPIDGSPSGSPIPGILQARTLEWVAISFSNAWKWKVKVKSLSRVRLVATPWTAAYQSPLSMGFSKQEYWSGLPLPSLDALLRLVHNPDVIGILSSS